MAHMQINHEEDVCGICGETGADKHKQPCRWPGEINPEGEFVHAECEQRERDRAFAEFRERFYDAGVLNFFRSAKFFEESFMNIKELIDSGKTLCRHDVKVEHLAWKLSTALESLAKEMNDREQYDLWKLWPCGAMSEIDGHIVGKSDDFEIVRVLCYDFNGHPEYWISDVS